MFTVLQKEELQEIHQGSSSSGCWRVPFRSCSIISFHKTICPPRVISEIISNHGSQRTIGKQGKLNVGFLYRCNCPMRFLECTDIGSQTLSISLVGQSYLRSHPDSFGTFLTLFRDSGNLRSTEFCICCFSATVLLSGSLRPQVNQASLGTVRRQQRERMQNIPRAGSSLTLAFSFVRDL